jgi:glucose-6-phosphate 1-epimerase
MIALPPSVRLVEPASGLPHLRVATPRASGTVFFHGAHVTDWTPAHAGRPVLWMSSRSAFRPDKAIRGGVPICFPWFGGHPSDSTAPAHGFARLAAWTLADVVDDGGVVTVTLTFDTAAYASPRWPHHARARYRVGFGGTLDMRLDVENVGQRPFSFEEALHTYLAVGDIGQAEVTGLESTDYLDKVDGFARKHQGAEPVLFTAETDRVYLDTASACRIVDRAWSRTIEVGKSGSRTTVVWNPWAAKAAGYSDFGPDEWRGMLCVETANVGAAAVHLEPGGVHAMQTAITVEG